MAMKNKTLIQCWNQAGTAPPPPRIRSSAVVPVHIHLVLLHNDGFFNDCVTNEFCSFKLSLYKKTNYSGIKKFLLLILSFIRKQLCYKIIHYMTHFLILQTPLFHAIASESTGYVAAPYL
jgi:hypothetical protein